MEFNENIPLEDIYENLFSKFYKSDLLKSKTIDQINIIHLSQPSIGSYIVVELDMAIDCMGSYDFERYIDKYGYSMFFYGRVTEKFLKYVEGVYIENNG